MFFRNSTTVFTGNYSEQIQQVKSEIETADAVLIGAGAGLSTSAGFDYSGTRFDRYFRDFAEKYGFRDMYSGGFYPFKTQEEYWAYWSRYISINRYTDAPKPIYETLRLILRNKDYFILTTNVDHCFQKAGFDPKRLFYTQGDYGLFQCSKPCRQKTYENEETIRRMTDAQGYKTRPEGKLILPEGLKPKMAVPTECIPHCPVCGAPMSVNLRTDDTFVQDGGWYAAAARCNDFIRKTKNARILFLELGVGYNTPVIIKYPFWNMTAQNPKAVYICINTKEAVCPAEIETQSICIQDDIGTVLNRLKNA